MNPMEIRVHLDQALKCRELAGLTDELRRGLLALADAWDDRARHAATARDRSPAEPRSPSLSEQRAADDRWAVSVREAGRLLGVGRSSIYRLIGEGQLETTKIGHRTLIRTASIRDLIAAGD